MERWVAGVCVAAVCTLIACGSTNAFVGGRSVSVQAAPWVVFVRSTFASNDHRDCTGSIIDARRVLTAAHCLFNSSGVFVRRGRTVVVAGVSNFDRPSASDHAQRRQVMSVRVYPGYVSREPPTDSDRAHDLAVLSLSRPLNLLGPAANAVAVPGRDAVAPADGVHLIAAGFGDRSRRGGDAGPLEETSTPVVNAKPCGLARLVCTSSLQSAPCAGDSGAGLVAPERKPMLVGVLTSITAVCERGALAAYVSLTTQAARAFIYGHSPSGAPPPAPATRWVPSGWMPINITDKNGESIPLSYSLPRTWRQSTNPSTGAAIFKNPSTGAQVDIGIFAKAGSEAEFFAKSRQTTPAFYRHLDPKARIDPHLVTLPVGTVLEFVLKLTVKAGSHRIELRSQDYFVFHDGTGYDVRYTGRLSNHSTDSKVFTRSAQTIHVTR